MKKIIIHIMSIFLSAAVWVSICEKSSAKPTSIVSFEVTYSDVANTFDIIDNVSNWWPGFCEEEYRKYWERKHPVSEQDLKLFGEYKAIREKYYDVSDQSEPDPSKNRNGVFAFQSILTSDPIAEAFYNAKTWDDAFNSLSKKLSPDELNFLRLFYSVFSQKVQPLLEESKVFMRVAQSVRKKVRTKSSQDFFSKVANFYGVASTVNYSVQYVWWPPIDRTNASPTGRFLVMRYNPIKHLNDAEADVDVAFHEVVHTISAMQTYEQKQSLSKAFLDKCPVQGRLKKSTLVEEPLAVIIGQAIYTKKFDPKNFSYTAKWYNEKWINLFSKLAYPYVSEAFQRGERLNEKMMANLGILCKDALAGAEKVAPRPFEQMPKK
jgi:hypothetical protein